jgi:hypothetical protein
MTPQTEQRLKLLEGDGWRQYQDVSRSVDTVALAKRFPTEAQCACNNERPGIQVFIYLCELHHRGETHTSYEIELMGELPDGTWVKLHQWAAPDDINEGLALIPRLIDTWEYMAQHP